MECITQRHLLETTLHKVADALSLDVAALRCESLVQLTFELSRMLKDLPQPDRRHFVLVFDGIDGQKEASPALLSALAKLSDIVRFAPITTILKFHLDGTDLPDRSRA